MTERVTDPSPEGRLPADEAGFSDESDEGAWFPIVGVGASAGGLEAFTQLLQVLPVDSGMAFVLVQHLAPSHASALAEILSRATGMPVSEVSDESAVEPNHVYVIPPDRSMVIADGVLRLLPREGLGSHRPVDRFFRALAEDRRHLAIGVILSGTASDGTLGLEAIKTEGGITFAQDSTAQQGGMPQSAIASGCVDFVLPPNEIGREIARISRHPYVVADPVAREADDEPDLAHVLRLLRQATGVDFTHYKVNTLYRRITRRMVFRRMSGLAEYVQCLRQTPAEVEALCKDILIGVTSFFRDPAAFEALKRTVFDRLLKDRSPSDPVRIWALGCSTGQEAYSLAIAFTEAAEAAGSSAALQLFATDINAVSIEKARAGVYPKGITQDVSPERVRRFFVEEEDGYRISRAIRDACIFSRHNVLSDPPFSRMDLISCRNLLIYMQPVLQQRVMPMLHYALKPSGCLWLGGSETVGAYRHLFDTEDDKHRIYAKKPGSESGHGLFPLHRDGVARSPVAPVTVRPSDAEDLPREADRMLLSRFAPPGVLVSADLDILQYRGDTSPYLAPAPGKASLNLLKMLREGLVVGVRAAILRAAKERAPVRETGLRVKSNGGWREVVLEVIPIRTHGGAKKAGYLLLFAQAGSAQDVRTAPESVEPPAADDDYRRLTKELTATRDYLQSAIEQQEAANEELQSANEEVQSANEELQSINEELETSKEEIDSSNEELATLNDELKNRNAALSRINDDLVNLLDSVQVAVVMLGRDLRVRRFTPQAEKLLSLIPADVGRPLADIRLDLDGLPDLGRLIKQVLDSAIPEVHDVRDKRGRWYSLRLRPYKTSEDKIDGVVMMLIDVDVAKRAHEYTESIVKTMHQPLLVFDADLRVRSASGAFHETFGTSPEDTVGRMLHDLGEPWGMPDLRARLEEVVSRGSGFNDYEVACELPQLGRRTMLIDAHKLQQADEATPSVLLAIEDITDRRLTAAALQVSEIRFRRLFETAQYGILILDAVSQTITHVNPFLVDLLGYPAEYFLGRKLWEVGLSVGAEKGLSAQQRMLEDGNWYGKLELEVRDGRHTVELVANVYEEEGRRVIQCNVHDITERNRLETLLRQHAAELSELHHRKDEFLAMLGHELRTPLAPIANAVQLLALQRDSESRIQKEARGIIERQLGQLKTLVDDLLDVSRISTGQVQIRREPVVVNDIVHKALETVRSQMQGRRHEFTLSLPDEPIWLNGDSVRLEQILANLLSNAIKYTDEGGQIWLTAERHGEQCVLRVRDTGIGIESTLLPRIFDMFTQAERLLDRTEGGLGIGLALVKKLTESHGGTVEVHSIVGEGSEFVVRLPVLPADSPLPPAPVAEADHPTTRPLRVLVVDDSEDTAASFSMLLRASGHDVRTACDGPTGLRAALDYVPHIVLLDIGLPDADGYEVARRIREERSLANVVLVALTGYGQEADRQRARQAGFDHHLVKPPDYARLEEILAGISERLR